MIQELIIDHHSPVAAFNSSTVLIAYLYQRKVTKQVVTDFSLSVVFCCRKGIRHNLNCFLGFNFYFPLQRYDNNIYHPSKMCQSYKHWSPGHNCDLMCLYPNGRVPIPVLNCISKHRSSNQSYIVVRNKNNKSFAI